ncbi:MAG TPA: hypothetical protein VLK82_28830 [Candidatus Tectomicrobia bacterium]|nr:hypothetical protein [Candidatus Tectomicrobia bacterium]
MVRQQVAKVSIEASKAFSIRSAMSGDSDTLPEITSDKVVQRMPRIATARVTE